MKLLLDDNLSPQRRDLLAPDGFGFEHVRDHGLQAASDPELLALDAARLRRRRAPWSRGQRHDPGRTNLERRHRSLTNQLRHRAATPVVHDSWV